MSLLTDGLFEANRIVVGILLGAVTLTTLIAVVHRVWRRLRLR